MSPREAPLFRLTSARRPGSASAAERAPRPPFRVYGTVYQLGGAVTAGRYLTPADAPALVSHFSLLLTVGVDGSRRSMDG
jgi:hypothetical protein